MLPGVKGLTPLTLAVRWWMKKGWGQTTGCQYFVCSSVLWHCWLDLGDRNDIWPVKKPCRFYTNGSLPQQVEDVNRWEPAPLLWNDLPLSIRSLRSFDFFKSCLKPQRLLTVNMYHLVVPPCYLSILWCSVCLSLTFVTFFVKKYFFSAYQL